MQAIWNAVTTAFKTGWEYFLDGVDYVASWIASYPKTTLALFVLYVMVRQ